MDMDTANSVIFKLLEIPEMDQPKIRTLKPANTRTRKTAWKERRRLANAPRSIQRRMLKRR